MQDNIELTTQHEILEKANNIIRKHEDFIHGMFVGTVKQHRDTLVYKGEFFLDVNGLPTTKKHCCL